MNEQLTKLNSLVASFVTVYKLQTGNLILHKKQFMLDELVKETLANFIYIVNIHELIHQGETKVPILADRERVTQVLVNLVSNAIKYSPRAHSVIVSITSPPQEVTLSVKDFGKGILKKDQKKIFERFYRVTGGDTKSRVPGLGLGLYVSNEIVEQHNGRMWVESAKNSGSTFYVTLPTGVRRQREIKRSADSI